MDDQEKQRAEQREQFLRIVIERLSNCPNANIMVIIDKVEHGLETYQSNFSTIWGFGVLAATEKMMDARYRMAMAEEDSRRKEVEMLKEIDSSLNSSKGKTN